MNGKVCTRDEFIEKARQVHGDKYDYSKVEYVNSKTPIVIVCPIHGEFKQKPSRHTVYKRGCPDCGDIMAGKKNIERCSKLFISKARKIHGDKYDYSKVIYTRNNEDVEIICPIHGSFKQTPNNHLHGEGCLKCRDDKNRELKSKTTELFIKEANIVHDNRYIYHKTEYKGSSEIVTITCPIHGDFKQEANSHLRGHGCPFCNVSKLEKEVRTVLKDKEILYEEQKAFEWLKNVSNLYLDFYLPQHNISIECQGIQHFEIVEHFGGENKYEIISFRDKLKKQLCDEHGIELIYFTHEKVEEPYLGKVFTDINDLLEYIRIKENNNG